MLEIIYNGDYVICPCSESTCYYNLETDEFEWEDSCPGTPESCIEVPYSEQIVHACMRDFLEAVTNHTWECARMTTCRWYISENNLIEDYCTYEQEYALRYFMSWAKENNISISADKVEIEPTNIY